MPPFALPPVVPCPVDATTVGALVRQVAPVAPDTRSELVRDRFADDETLLALPVVDGDGRVHGILNRFRFLERFASRFGRELAARKPVSAFLEPGFVVDQATPLDDVGAQLAAEPGRFILDGFVVTSRGRYHGVGTAFDIFRAAIERRHADLQHRALHDSLTGLPNRDAFEQRLAAALAAADGSAVAVLFIDLDRFKDVNDSHGHRFGDLVLIHTAARLRGAVRRDDLVARLSGDEFAIVLEGVAGPDEAVRIAQVLVSACGRPVTIDGRDVSLSCSVGVALCPQHATAPEDLIRASDAALYGAKEVRNHWQLYEPEAHDGRAPVRAAALRQALDLHEIEVHYQPIVSLADGRLLGAEALVRWTHSVAGPVPASHIVKLAEDSGLIVALGTYVAEVALAELTRWDRLTGTTELRMALNISALQVREGGLVGWLDHLVARTGVAPGRIELEFTETGALRGGTAIHRTFEALADRGFVLTIDDFGTGYSALSRLERLPVSAMKIDRSFVGAIGTPGRGGTIAQAIAAMGRSLGLTVIAEGVETELQRAFLADAGCQAAQGYLLGRPQPGHDFRRLLQHHPRRAGA